MSTKEKPTALRELHRVLKPGLRIVIADFGWPAGSMASIEFFLLRLFDEMGNTRVNGSGLMPKLIEEAGFSCVHADQHIQTPFGTIEFIEGGA